MALKYAWQGVVRAGLVVHRSGPLRGLVFGLKAMAALVWSKRVIAAAGGAGKIFNSKFESFNNAVLTHFGK